MKGVVYPSGIIQFAIKRGFFLAVAATAMIATIGLTAAPAAPNDWSKVRLYGHAFNNNDFTTAEYDFIFNNFWLFTIEKRHAQSVYGQATTEQASRLTANKIVARRPSTRVLYYWNTSVVWDAHYSTIQNILAQNPSWAETDSSSPSGKSWAFPTTASQNWWANAPNVQIDSSSLYGIFADAVPKAEERGKLDVIKAQLPRIKGMKIYNGYRIQSSTKVLGGSDVLSHADGVFVEAFFSYSVDDTAKAQKLMDELLAIPSHKYIICRGSGQSVFGSSHNFSLAAFLIVANGRSFYSWGGANNSYDATQMTYWHQDFGRRLGSPKGVAVKNGYVYTRSFDYADVTVDVHNKTSNIVWK